LNGLYSDTGSFKHSNTDPLTLKIASNLVAKGADYKKIGLRAYDKARLDIGQQSLQSARVIKTSPEKRNDVLSPPRYSWKNFCIHVWKLNGIDFNFFFAIFREQPCMIVARI